MPETDTAVQPRLTVYGRRYCHLCDDMIAALQVLQGRYSFEFDVVDVDTDRVLDTSLGERVPVLMHGEHELCHYFLNEAAVTAYLSNLR